MRNSINQWKLGFAKAVRIAIDQDYFSDIFEFDLGGENCTSDEERENLWKEMKFAFNKIFNEKY